MKPPSVSSYFCMPYKKIVKKHQNGDTTSLHRFFLLPLLSPLQHSLIISELGGDNMVTVVAVYVSLNTLDFT